VNALTATFYSNVTAQSSAELSRSRSPSNLISGLDLSSVHRRIDTYLMMPCAICGD